ncbi:T9SS C-terminal target domain-containing protein [Candidatus Sumerlaeota bacterium]|nr:T9SS C-terminal target domain-containing protein [Candidatus Sumerlaeota bacterium]
MKPMQRLVGTPIAIVVLSGLAHGAELKVDFSFPERKDAIDPHYAQWVIPEAVSVNRTFDGVAVTFRKSGPAGTVLTNTWYKGGVDYDARMATDGITVKDGYSGGRIEMEISGLAPGHHSVATYHNTYDKPLTNTFSNMSVSLNGTPVIASLTPTNRILNNYDAASAYVEFDVSSDETVTILFVPDGTGWQNNVTISGFEIDTGNPKKKAIKPEPPHDDEHADGDTGSTMLSWTAAASAVSHDVYFGTDFSAVDSATSASAEFMGNQTGTIHLASTPNIVDNYYWRVDEVAADGTRTKGEIWRFRRRHLAFPGAEGYGRFARGGRWGDVIEVTNLDDGGPGSLRAAVEATGPRTIVFNVSGTIALARRLVLKNPYCTVAGQTAPGMGICIRDYDFGMGGMKDGIIRYVRVRVGKEVGTRKTLGGMGMAGTDHSIIDHCSISWTTDEAFSSRSAKNITLQRTLISEALHVAGHRNYRPGKSHGYAASIGGDIASFHHNLLAHCEGRNWSLAGGIDAANRHTGSLDIRNNVVYNWDGRTTDGGAEFVHFVRNYYKPGPASGAELDELNPQFENPRFGPQICYVEGNVMEGVHGPEGPMGPFRGVDPHPETPYTEFTVTAPFFESYVETQTAAEAYADVLADVGCNRPGGLDLHDRRITSETLNGTFTYRGSVTDRPGLPDNQADVGGWETYPEESRPAGWDTDHDGLPNWWEDSVPGLDSSDPADRNGDPDGDGYTNLEDYLNYLTSETPVPPPHPDGSSD